MQNQENNLLTFKTSDPEILKLQEEVKENFRLIQAIKIKMARAGLTSPARLEEIKKQTEKRGFSK